MSTANADLVELGDLDALTRQIDRLCAARDWDGLVDLRDRSRRALDRGRQLWPIAAHAEYRLALEAPGRWAAAVLVPGAGRFALGPLPEVAASTHTWEELAPHVAPGPAGGLAAHERVTRGEDLTDDARVDPQVLDLPLRLQPWEPTYPTALYRAHDADFADVALPPDPPLRPLAPMGARPLQPIDDPDAVRALVDLVTPWTAESNGAAKAVAVRGPAAAAIRALGVNGARSVEVDAGHALALMAWTGASGGAHGRRRGMAAGRFAAWWALAALAGLLDEWPVAPDDLGEVAAELRWHRWDEGHPDSGWALRLAVEDPAEGLAWAVAAVDHRTP